MHMLPFPKAWIALAVISQVGYRIVWKPPERYVQGNYKENIFRSRSPSNGQKPSSNIDELE